MSPTIPKIAIIGAGPASLTLASLLQTHSIPFTIYEAAPEIRHQGGSLDLHPHTGQRALHEAGLFNTFMKYARPECEVMKLVDVVSGEVFIDENEDEQEDVFDPENSRPEIDRGALLNLLFENLRPGSVKFFHKVTSVTPSASSPGKHDIHFANHPSETNIDLVIGGDGTWSKVRPLLTDTKPVYSGISVLEVWAKDVESNAWLSEFAGAGSMFAFGEGCAVQAQRQGDGSLRTYASLRVPEIFWEEEMKKGGFGWDGLEGADGDVLRERYVGEYLKHIDPSLQRVVLESRDRANPRILWELPVGTRWEGRSGVTVIGDAAHVMTPFGGIGVNLAMTDALVLGGEIRQWWEGKKGLDEATRGYEEEMFGRAEKGAKHTGRGKANHFAKDGARDMAERIREKEGVDGVEEK
ncbi:hypothetical protein B0J11DRAFT_529642 [Dendryphion nanum]|uniref:FAD-binding domain-containing protein n=1 Tax=Dendryphion nanum TaxID=256645 RepID=A0A9P9DRG5_9PLEO|nr:hypothetical protein B0J11DRAFT_529642 [Dendryphion nanum]